MELRRELRQGAAGAGMVAESRALALSRAPEPRRSDSDWDRELEAQRRVVAWRDDAARLSEQREEQLEEQEQRHRQQRAEREREDARIAVERERWVGARVGIPSSSAGREVEAEIVDYIDGWFTVAYELRGEPRQKKFTAERLQPMLRRRAAIGEERRADRARRQSLAEQQRVHDELVRVQRDGARLQQKWEEQYAEPQPRATRQPRTPLPEPEVRCGRSSGSRRWPGRGTAMSSRSGLSLKSGMLTAGCSTHKRTTSECATVLPG